MQTMSYPGGKGASGAYQKIISWMPPHDFYAELFAGYGYIFRTKRPAAYNLALDVDRNALNKITPLQTGVEKWGHPNGPLFETRHQNAIEFLEKRIHAEWNQKSLLYLDPPYLPCTLSRPAGSTRNGQRYKFKFGPEAHQRLLELIVPLKCYVMISGYASAMYDRALASWTRKEFQCKTRHGVKTEVVWMNFNPDVIPQRHDWRFYGKDYRERERLQKKLKRLRRKLTEVNVFERNFLLHGIGDLYDVKHP